jgi:HPt (histidine-containing phosphotransfer) domain-containing protein
MNTDTLPPVDLDHLARQAGGSTALAREVLRLFLDGIPGDFAKLKAATGKDRAEAAHLIVGSARAIGAGRVAAAAAAIEAGDKNLSNLESALDEARRFISAYLGR